MLTSAVQRTHHQADVIFFTSDFPIGKQCWIFRINCIYEVWNMQWKRKRWPGWSPKNLGWGRQENNICFYRFSLLFLSMLENWSQQGFQILWQIPWQICFWKLQYLSACLINIHSGPLLLSELIQEGKILNFLHLSKRKDFLMDYVQYKFPFLNF